MLSVLLMRLLISGRQLRATSNEQRAAAYTQYANGVSDIDTLINEPGRAGQFEAGDQATWKLIMIR
jgi:hypothetical protein